MLHMMLCYLSRYIEDKRRRDWALREIKQNGWRCVWITDAQAMRRARSWRRAG